MPIHLSKKCRKVAGRLFQEPQRSEIIRRLIEEASENIPFCEKHDLDDMDRIRFSIVKLIAEHGQKEDGAFELAKIDWRDLFMNAGFGASATEHLSWYAGMFPNEANQAVGRRAW